MEYRHEIITYNESIPVKIFVHQLGFAPMHWHNSIEMIFALSGNVRVNVGGNIYVLHQHDIILINSNYPHELYSENAILVAVQIKLSLFDNRVLNQKELYFVLNPEIDTSHPGIYRIKKIIAQFIKNHSAEGKERILRAKSLSYELLAELIESFGIKQEPGSRLNTQDYNRIASIITFINAHYRENLTLSMLAENEFLSNAYLSRFFKKMMGTNFVDYLNQIRMNHAVNDLLETDMTIEVLSEKNGFPNTQIFSQRFRKQYGMLPSLYRKQNRRKPGSHFFPKSDAFNEYTILETHRYLDYFAPYLNDPESTSASVPFKTGNADTNTDIRLDAPVTVLRHTWKCFTSVGSAKDLMLHDIQEMLRKLQSDVGFRYIKFHGILSDDMHVYHKETDGSVSYSFVYIDKILDFILSIGLKPLIELGFTPRELAAYPDRYIYSTNMINSPPKSESDWKNLICAFIRHLILRYGKNEILSWLFTVWNEPDTPESMFGFPDIQEFYHFWEITYHAIRSIEAQIQIGTPSSYLDIDDNANFLDKFTAWCRLHSCVPDFVIIHYYGTSLNKENLYLIGKEVQYIKLQLTTDPARFHKSVIAAREYINKLYNKETSIYLTEWNISPSHTELLGDTCFRSCYMVKNILENMDLLDSVGYWMLTDAFDEYQLPDDLFHGGLGMFTYNQIPKPVYYAFTLLQKLGNELISRGNGYFITRRENTYQIMFYYYKHYSDLYASGEAFDMSRTNRYTSFEPEEEKTFRLHLTPLSAGTYKLTEYIVNRNYGSSFDAWIRMGAPAQINEEETDYLKGISRPGIRKRMLEVTDGSLTLDVSLELLEIRLITICPN